MLILMEPPKEAALGMSTATLSTGMQNTATEAMDTVMEDMDTHIATGIPMDLLEEEWMLIWEVGMGIVGVYVL